MKTSLLVAFFCLSCIRIAFCQQSLDNYVLDSTKNSFVLVASASNSVSSPVDIDFHPDKVNRPFELWILNQGTESTGGSTVIVSNANQNTRTYKYVKDGNAWHFMSMASALAFGDSDWATSADVLDANHGQGGSGIYTGPSLWSSNLSIYGVVGNPSSQTVNGSHLDMIHQSPFGKGIAFEKGLAFWVLDGFEKNLKRYDYVSPHQPGGSDHSAGEVRVYTDFTFKKHATLPSHIIIDANRKYLYGCDPVGKRIFRVDIKSGSNAGLGVKVNNEPLSGYYKFTGLITTDVVTSGLTAPVGIDVYGDRLVVTDNGTSEIIIYNITNNFSEVGRLKVSYTSSPNLMGIKVGPDGKLYFADKINKKVYMIENSAVLPLAIEDVKDAGAIASIFPNPLTNELSIRLKDIGDAEISISNLLGEAVYKGTLTNSNSVIDLSAIKSGIYFLQIESGGKRTLQKIIKH